MVIGFPAHAQFNGRPVEDLRDPTKARVVELTLFGATQIPNLKTIIQEGDLIHLAVARTALLEMEDRLGFHIEREEDGR